MFSYTDVYFPILQCLSDEKVRSKKEIYQYIKEYYQLSNDELSIKTSSGVQAYKARVDWAITNLCYFKDIAPIIRIQRGICQITKIGIQAAESQEGFKEWYELFKEYRKNWNKKVNKKEKNYNSIFDETNESSQSPQEQIDQLNNQLNEALKIQILDEIKNQSPQFFEDLVLNLLDRMGYGLNGQKSLTQNSADGGIDGIISEDELGLSKIYIQAKRWGNNISRPELQKFVGAISDKPTKKGVFITTSDFSREAIEFAKKSQSTTIVLINGNRLCDLMIKYKLGVYVEKTIELCKIDQDFFEN
ncbi:restriction endonuclease [Rodentibacter myodis]|uniref:Restriction endonuclease n=1 Tax=Rodentibacter myodis TaxID=1907939 RepID=A0A1V3JRE7_9PAST|nr:restriction endonuclease [Rodentibacter myodis]OOF58965.1 restriction endonuclease [Rodentibacter myodis]